MRKKTRYHGHELRLILKIYLCINRITCMQSCFALASEVFSTQVQINFWYVKLKMLVLNCLCQPEQEKVTFLDCSVSLKCVIIILKAQSFSPIFIVHLWGGFNSHHHDRLNVSWCWGKWSTLVKRICVPSTCHGGYSIFLSHTSLAFNSKTCVNGTRLKEWIIKQTSLFNNSWVSEKRIICPE